MSGRLGILLGPGLDGGTSWRHLLDPDGARAGWVATGPNGFVRQIALRAGAPADVAAPAERVAAAAVALAEADDGARRYSRSRSVDPLGTARRMLDLYDELRWAGWDGSRVAGSQRLADLALLAGAVPQGPADVAHAALAALEGGFVPAFDVRLTAPIDELPPVVGRLLEALPDVDPPAAMQSDAPTMVLLEAETPGEAAELVAAWMVDHPSDRRTVVVGAEAAALRSALRRRGLPGVDATEISRHRPELQVLPLRLGLAFRPQDPRRALELLMLPRAPMPWAVRKELISALNEAPGIGGPAWQAALVELAEVEGAEAVQTWFGGDLANPEVGLPAGRAAAICGDVTKWAGGRGYEAAGAVSARLRRMLDGRDTSSTVPRLELLRMYDEAVGTGIDGDDLPVEAGGAAQCGSPDAVLPGAQQVIWWGFVDSESPAATPWRPGESEALAHAGASLPAPGASRATEARTWRRALSCASQHVVLVRWRLSGASVCAPHPLTDELEVELGADELLRRTVTAEQVVAGAGWPAQVVARAVSAPAPGPSVWAPGAAHLRRHKPESPSSIGRMLSCPLRWTLQYPAKLRVGARASMPDGPRLVGTFMHALLQDLLLSHDPPTEPDDAARQAVALFDARLEGEAAPLLMPGRGFDRAEGRRAIGRAAASLVTLLEAGGWRAILAEEELGGSFAGGQWAGFADLVLERDEAPTRGVIDLKLGRSSNRRTELAEGRALQIALYAQGVSPPGSPRGPAAYFTITDGRTVTVDAGAFPGSVDAEGDDLDDTVSLAEEGFRWWRSVLDTGAVAARPLLDEEDSERINAAATGDPPESGPPAAKATCDWCDFQGLCLTGRQA